MKDRTLLLSVLLAGATHALILACDLPAPRPLQIQLPLEMEVALVAAPRAAVTREGPPAPAQAKRTQEKPRRAPQKSVPPLAPKEEIIAPAPAPSAVTPEQADEPVAPEEPPVVEPEAAVSEQSRESGDGAVEQGGPLVAAGSEAGVTSGVSTVAEFGGNSGEVDKSPAYLHNPKPRYPYSARQAGQQGTTVLRVEVLFSGRAGKIIIEQSAGYELLDTAAVEAVKRWKFSPAEKGRQRVTAWVKIPIEFDLRDKP